MIDSKYKAVDRGQYESTSGYEPFIYEPCAFDGETAGACSERLVNVFVSSFRLWLCHNPLW